MRTVSLDLWIVAIMIINNYEYAMTTNKELMFLFIALSTFLSIFKKYSINDITIEIFDIQFSETMHHNSLVLFLSFICSIYCACPDEIGWIPTGESCYLISVEAMDWYTAQQVPS